jgi:betaine-aldehyde dehydrogenase
VAPKQLQNFVGGKYVTPTSDKNSPVINPSTEETYAHAPVSSERDVQHAYEVAQKAFESWSQTTPSERQLALFRIADALEARAEEAADVESENTGKPRATLVDYEMAPSVDQIRFFAGAARNLEGRATAEYTRDHPPRTNWRYRSGNALELPAEHGRVEVCSCHCSRKHNCPEAF